MNWLSRAPRINFITPINPVTNPVIPAKQALCLLELESRA